MRASAAAARADEAVLPPAAELLQSRLSVTLAELHNVYMQTYNEQKQQRGGQGPAGAAGAQQPLRPVSLVQMQAALMQLTDMVNVRSGSITKKAAIGGGGGDGGGGAR